MWQCDIISVIDSVWSCCWYRQCCYIVGWLNTHARPSVCLSVVESSPHSLHDSSASGISSNTAVTVPGSVDTDSAVITLGIVVLILLAVIIIAGIISAYRLSSSLSSSSKSTYAPLRGLNSEHYFSSHIGRVSSKQWSMRESLKTESDVAKVMSSVSLFHRLSYMFAVVPWWSFFVIFSQLDEWILLKICLLFTEKNLQLSAEYHSYTVPKHGAHKCIFVHFLDGIALMQPIPLAVTHFSI